MLHFNLPTEIFMGEGCVAANAARIAKLGKKALIVTGRSSAKLCGALGDLCAALDETGVGYTVWDKAMPNPTIDSAYDCAAAAKEAGADFIAAIGGGSPMDTAKAAALLAAQDVAREDLFSGKYGRAVLQSVFIPTTSGTGSEVTQYSILTNDAAKTKTTLATPEMFPNLALLDYRYTRAVPHTTLINTAVDAFSHCVESYLNNRSDKLSSGLALEGCAVFGEVIDRLATESPDDEVLEKLQYMSLLGGICIAQTGTAAAHAMGYSLTYFRHIDHGRANGLLLPEFVRLTAASAPEKVDSLLLVMGLEEVSELDEKLGLLLGEREVFTADELEHYAPIASAAKNVGNCLVKLDKDAILKAYQAALL